MRYNSIIFQSLGCLSLQLHIPVMGSLKLKCSSINVNYIPGRILAHSMLFSVFKALAFNSSI